MSDWLTKIATFALALGFGVVASNETRAQSPTQDIPLLLTSVDSTQRLGIYVGIGSGAQKLYLFDTGSSSFNAAYVPAGPTSWWPSTITPGSVAVNYTYELGSGYQGTIAYVPTLAFYSSGSATTAAATLTAPAAVPGSPTPAGFQINAVTTHLLSGGAVDPNFQSNLANNVAPINGTFFGTFGASDFVANKPSISAVPIGGVLGQATTSGYVVAANGQPSASSVNGPQVGQSVTSCSPCVMLGLTPSLLAQFPVKIPWSSTGAANFPVSNANSSTETGATFQFSLSTAGQTPVTWSGPTLLDTGTGNVNLNSSVSYGSYVNSSGYVKAGVTVTVAGNVTGAANSSYTATDFATSGVGINTYHTEASAGTSNTVGIGFFLQNSVLFDLNGQALGYTSNFVTDAAITTPLTVGSDSVPLGLAGVISGTGGVSITNGGSATLSGTNTYTGQTAVTAGGQLYLAGPGSIAASSGVAVDGLFDISMTSGGASIKTLSGAGQVMLGGQALTLTNASGTFGGVIADGGFGGGTGGSLIIAGGTQTLAGNNTYTGGTSVQGGTLVLTGSLPGLMWVSPSAGFVVGSAGTLAGDVINSGSVNNNGAITGVFVNAGLLSGNGSIGWLDMLPGSIVAPGNSVGTIQVGANLAAAPGSTYQVQVAGNTSDQIQVGGTATLSGGTVAASLISYNPVLGYPYPIVTATAGVAGTFATATADNLPFIRPTLSYDPIHVFLTLTRNSVPFASVATSPNQVAVANAVDAGPAASGLGLALTSQQSAAGAQRAFDALSGELHASAQTVMLNDSLYVREALLGRMRQASFAGGIGPTAALATGGPTVAYAQESAASLPPTVETALAYGGRQQLAIPVKAAPAAGPATTFWTQGIDSWGRLGGDGNAANASHTLAGFFSGVDHRFGPNWLAGVAGGYTDGSISVNGRASSANIDTAHLAGYAAANAGPWNVRTAAAVSFSTLGTNRSIAFPGFFDTATARYDASTAQVFGEVGYGMRLGNVAAEPFGGLAFVHLHANGFSESGGLAALSGSGQDSDIGYSTLGGRAATGYVIFNGMVLTPRLSAAWQHAFGPVTPTEALVFRSTAEPFTVAGLPLVRDMALLETGLDLRLGPQTRIGLFYTGQFGDHARNHTVQGSLTWRF